MGIETAIIVSAVSTAIGAVSTMSSAKKQAKAVVQQANIAADNTAKKTALRAASAKTSFLNSGLTLEGTPMTSINEMYTTGLADIAQIRSNADTQSKNIMSQARMSVFKDIASSAAGQAAGGFMQDVGSSFGDALSASKGTFVQNFSSNINSIYTNKSLGKIG